MSEENEDEDEDEGSDKDKAIGLNEMGREGSLTEENLKEFVEEIGGVLRLKKWESLAEIVDNPLKAMIENFDLFLFCLFDFSVCFVIVCVGVYL